MTESELFMFSAIQNLANNISLSFNMMNIRMNQLERNIKEKISTNIQTAQKTQIQEEEFKVKDEIKQDIQYSSNNSLFTKTPTPPDPLTAFL
jgi:uncharacterized protein YdcH (DUF465 family)